MKYFLTYCFQKIFICIHTVNIICLCISMCVYVRVYVTLVYVCVGPMRVCVGYIDAR